MQNPSVLYAPHTSRPASTRYTGIAFAALVNAMAIWAILNGLNLHPSPPPPQPTTFQILKPDVQPTPPMKQPPVTLVTPTTPTQTVVPKPDIKVQSQPDQNTIATTTLIKPSLAPSIPDSAASGVMDTHTTPPYPGDARNLSHQGTVTLALSIDATGAVTNAQVRVSSGYPELDQSAVGWVIAHWRYRPAIQNGVPVASASTVAVKFDLKNAR